MNDTTSTSPSPGDDPRPNRGAGFLAVGAILVVVGIILAFVDGLSIVSWMLIPGGVVWLIIGLTAGRRASGPTPARTPRSPDRRDDGSTPWVSADASGQKPDRSPDDQPANDSSDGGGGSGSGFGGSDGGGDGGGGGGGD